MTLSGWRWLLVPLALVVGSGWGVMVARWKEPTPPPASTPTPTSGHTEPTAGEPEAESSWSHLPVPPIPPDFFQLPVADPEDGPAPPPVQVGQILAIEVLETLPGRPITGERVVRSDGTISLGFYGDLHVAGLDRRQIKVRLIERLRDYINDEVLGLTRQDLQTGKVELVPPVRSNRIYVDDEVGAPINVQPQPQSTDTAALLQRLDALEREVKALQTARPDTAAVPADAPKD